MTQKGCVSRGLVPDTDLESSDRRLIQERSSESPTGGKLKSKEG